MVTIKDGLGRNLYDIDENGNEINHSKYYYENKKPSSEWVTLFIIIGFGAMIVAIGFLINS